MRAGKTSREVGRRVNLAKRTRADSLSISLLTTGEAFTVVSATVVAGSRIGQKGPSKDPNADKP